MGHGLQSLPLKWSAVTCILSFKTMLLTWYKSAYFPLHNQHIMAELPTYLRVTGLYLCV